jgi:hypothetical protein
MAGILLVLKVKYQKVLPISNKKCGQDMWLYHYLPLQIVDAGICSFGTKKIEVLLEGIEEEPPIR